MTLTLNAISHQFSDQPVLESVDLSVAPGEIVCLLGPSGSGKSTLLRLIAGLETLQQGSMELNGRPLASAQLHLPPEQRNIGLVFQDHALFPHLSVADNLAFGLQHLASAERAKAVTQRLADIGLSGFENRYPHTLSGGQQQRIALGRALAPQPAAMLLDEPFASVDATLRRQLREDARARLKASNSPTIVVTHDPDEALELADRIAVMVAGRIVALDTPENVWRAPADRFVAELFGDAQTLPGRLTNNQINTAFGCFDLPVGRTALSGEKTALSGEKTALSGEKTALSGEETALSGETVDTVVRPQDIQLTRGTSAITVQDIRFLGDRYLIIIASGEQTLRVVSPVAPALSVGDQVQVTFAAEQVLIYPKS